MSVTALSQRMLNNLDESNCLAMNERRQNRSFFVPWDLRFRHGAPKMSKRFVRVLPERGSQTVRISSTGV